MGNRADPNAALTRNSFSTLINTLANRIKRLERKQTVSIGTTWSIRTNAAGDLIAVHESGAVTVLASAP